MKKDPTLLVLAAGMGSRYGGLKQMDAFGPSGETILDYSIYDAIEAGFEKVVFVVREHFIDDFRSFFRGKFDDKIESVYVTQELSHIPPGYDVHPERQKPWGTAHAVAMAEGVIDEPFCVINADDYYGRDAYKVIARYFKDCLENDRSDYALVAYDLVNTLSTHGTVNRGICSTDGQGFLKGIEETLGIGYDAKGAISFEKHGTKNLLEPSTPVSMNMWGFFPDYFDFYHEAFARFLADRGMELKSEFFIPLLIDELIVSGQKKVAMLHSSSSWFGVTYQEDKPAVVSRLNDLVTKGTYPANLWSA